MITTATAQPASTPPRSSRRPSINNPISGWLSRASSHGSSHSHSSSINNPIRISEPKLVNETFTYTGGLTYTHARYGTLGSGATIVRTPQDALTRAMVTQIEQPPPQENPGIADDDVSSYEEDEEPVSPGSSPPLPPLPLASKSSPNLPVLSEMGELLVDCNNDTPNPSPIKQARVIARPMLKTNSTSPAFLPAFASQTLPLHISLTPAQPSFTPILLSPVPDVLLDPSSLLITLETSTSSLRTTYSTLTSRPSHLSDYLQSLVTSAYERERKKFRDTLVEMDEELEDDAEAEDGHDLSQPNTPFASLFAAHLTSAGLIPQSAGMLHLFLDRPSAPYTHILSYLRSPASALPRNALHSQEQLLDIRDEAKYLGLDELHKLCCDEIRREMSAGRATAGHMRAVSSVSSVHSHSSAGSASGQQVAVVPMPIERGRLKLREAPKAKRSAVEGGVKAQGENEDARSSTRSPARSKSPHSAKEWI